MSMTLSYASPLIDTVVKSHSTNSATRSGVSTSIHMCRSVSVDGVGAFSSHLLCSPQTETHVHHRSLRWTGIHNAPEAMSLQHRPFLVAGDRPPHTGYSCIVQVIILLYSPLNTTEERKWPWPFFFWRSRHLLASASPHSQVERIMSLWTSRVQTVIFSKASPSPQDQVCLSRHKTNPTFVEQRWRLPCKLQGNMPCTWQELN